MKTINELEDIGETQEKRSSNLNIKHCSGDEDRKKQDSLSFANSKTHFEDIIKEIGDYGKLQKQLVWLFVLPFSIVIPFITIVVMFQLSTPDFKCIPSFPNGITQPSLVSVFDNFTEPLNGGILGELNYTIFQRGWNVSEDQCSFRGIEGNDTAVYKCTNFHFSKDDFDETIPTSWNLVCDKQSWTTILYTIGSAGCAIGTLFFGFLSDHIGRKPTYFVTVILSFLSNLVSLATSNLYVFAVSRFINGSIFPTVYQLPYIIALELVGPRERTFMLAGCSIGWTIGLCLLPLVAYYTRHWYTLMMIATVVVLPFFFYFRLIPESPRWLLSLGRFDDAEKVIKTIATKNGSKIPDNLREKLMEIQEEVIGEKAKTLSYMDLFRTPRLRRHVFLVTLSWCTCSATYDVLHMNVEHLIGNQFLNFFMLAAVEFPSYLLTWYMMESLGRRVSMVIFQGSTALFGLLATLVETGMIGLPSSVTVASAIIIKFCVCSAYMVVYQQATELFPTSLRNSGLSGCTAAASIMSCFSPYIVSLNQHGSWIPMLFVGILGIMSAITSSLVPETANYPLCQTLDEARRFGKNQKFWSLNKRKRSTVFFKF